MESGGSLDAPLHIEVYRQNSQAKLFSLYSANMSDVCEGSLCDERQKRKMWTRKEKLEFVRLFKQLGNKCATARRFKEKYKITVNSRTYNHWIDSQFQKIGSESWMWKKTTFS